MSTPDRPASVSEEEIFEVATALPAAERAAYLDAACAGDGALRARVAVLTGLAVLAYVVTVYLIFFLTYTPLNVDHVRGVQGRYFVIALPMAAIFVASMTNVDLPRGGVAATAITGSLLSGLASFQALLGAHWSVP
jgi:hypothetical protein